MKEFAAFILLIVLVCVGWNQPYKAHFSSVVGEPPPVPALPAKMPQDTASTSVAQTQPPPAVPQATPARDSSWLWNKTSMDEAHSDKGGKRGR